jgi:predicted SAM-dependent methyltransferase
MDAAEAFPFNDSTFHYVYAEHMIEHLSYDQGHFMLRECFRVLVSEGKIRISTPNLETLIGLCLTETSEAQQRYIKWVVDGFLPKTHGYGACFVINHVFHSWGHRFIYDRTTLQSLLEEAGFSDISWHAMGESDDINLSDLESHGKGTGDEEMVEFETMVVQATRP